MELTERGSHTTLFANQIDSTLAQLVSELSKERCGKKKEKRKVWQVHWGAEYLGVSSPLMDMELSNTLSRFLI